MIFAADRLRAFGAGRRGARAGRRRSSAAIARHAPSRVALDAMFTCYPNRPARTRLRTGSLALASGGRASRLVRGALESVVERLEVRASPRSGARARGRSGGRRARRSWAAAARAGRCRSGCRAARPRGRRCRCCRSRLRTLPNGSAPGPRRVRPPWFSKPAIVCGPSSPRWASIVTLPISRGPSSRTVSRSAMPSPGSLSSPSW